MTVTAPAVCPTSSERPPVPGRCPAAGPPAAGPPDAAEPPAAPARAAAGTGAAGPYGEPVTVTLEITLSGDRVPAAAARLAQAVRELAGALGEDAVRVVAPAGWPEARPPGPRTAAPDDGLYVYPASRTVLRGGTPVRLTRLEFDLLLFLAEHRDRAFRRLDLLRAVWGYDQTGVRTVDVHVRRLRAKVGEATPLVATVHGVGYRLDERARVRVVWDRRPAPRS